MAEKMTPSGYRYEKTGAETKLTLQPSKYHKSRGYTETVLYAGPDVSVIGRELLASKLREADLGTILGRVCMALLTREGISVTEAPAAAPATAP